MKVKIIYGRLPAKNGARSYTYYAPDSVVVGDVVEVPPSVINPEPQIATVVEIGSDYDGPIKPILSIVEKAD